MCLVDDPELYTLLPQEQIQQWHFHSLPLTSPVTVMVPSEEHLHDLSGRTRLSSHTAIRPARNNTAQHGAAILVDHIRHVSNFSDNLI